MLLDLCLALGIPSPRHLESILARKEIELWISKMRLDQFSRHGQDVRDAVRMAQLHSWIAALAGKKKSMHPRKFMIRFDRPPEDTPETMRRKMIAIAKAFGGTVNGK